VLTRRCQEGGGESLEARASEEQGQVKRQRTPAAAFIERAYRGFASHAADRQGKEQASSASLTR